MMVTKKRHIHLISSLVMILVVIVTLYPFLNVLAKSLNDAVDTVKGGITIFPRKPTIKNYSDLFTTGSNLGTAFFNSVIRTILGSFLGTLCCAMFAYPLSRHDFIARKPFLRILIITMYVSGGLIPGYLLMRNLHLLNSFWVYIIPSLISAYNIILIRSFMLNIPQALSEAARIDGANDLTIFFKIILPMCKPVLATVMLFVAVGHWNDWYSTYIYMTRSHRTSLSTLQFELMKVLDSVSQTGSSVDIHSEALKNSTKSPEAIKMAITIVCTVPILIVYPFVQKYFVSGITLGAVKE
ncbi:carbohydrate ABC transporter permease [Treponema sp.]|uniref:carbohydrate ABC transporter permease n=1 Tax=Treponema sp. TaxID=166 RepID=UPI0025D40A81|nr:carbohydrate ABC transporter permease [Treponema sp.]MCR5218182.1 carbohydrate ABC transporter permease [Treponema sp.]